jgi:hypothetical protein
MPLGGEKPQQDGTPCGWLNTPLTSPMNKGPCNVPISLYRTFKEEGHFFLSFPSNLTSLSSNVSFSATQSLGLPILSRFNPSSKLHPTWLKVLTLAYSKETFMFIGLL